MILFKYFIEKVLKNWSLIVLENIIDPPVPLRGHAGNILLIAILLFTK
jgi:hypothetical protein